MEFVARSLVDLTAALPLPRKASRSAGAASAYRRPIDGLRAVAVGTVVLFHFGVQPFSGGFVGVDVFFVISGFLITRLLLADIEAGRPVLAGFYERRILRLYPALFAMLAASLAAALVLLYPTDLKRYAESLASTAGLGSNMLFRNSFGYFNSAADQKPLLHTWSLSVEEQFYLVYPFLLAPLVRRSRRAAAAVLGLLSAVSLGACAWATHAAPLSAFYLTPYRFWELMLGGLIPLLGVAAPASRAASGALAWGGLGLIGWGVFGYTAETPFPGVAALPPCLGAAAVILSCEGPESNGLARILALDPVAALGRISYSLYLWHWPVMVFAGQWLFRRPDGPETAALIALSVGLAALSYRFVEQPFRHPRRAFGGRAVFAGAAAAMAATALCGGAVVAGRGLPQRFPPEVRAVLDAANTAVRTMPPALGCLDPLAPAPEGGEACHIGAGIAAEPDFVVWGDSLAVNLFPLVAEGAIGRGRSGLLATFHACAPLDGVDALRVRGCGAFNAAMEARILASPSVRTVVLVSFWAAAVSPLHPDPGRSEALLSDTPSEAPTPAGSRRAFDRGLDRLVAALTARGKEVVIVASVPEVGVHVPESLARLAQGRGDDPAPTRAAYLERQSAVFASFAASTRRHGARVIYPHEVLCRAERCSVAADGHPLYIDAAHVNYHGASELRPLFADLF